MKAIFLAAFLVITASAASADGGSAQIARDMLARVAAAVHQDQEAALHKFETGADGFRNGDIYPFCFNVETGIVLTGQTAGRDIRTFSGAAGQKIFDAAQQPEGVITEIAYPARRPPPADATPVSKVSVVQRVGQIGCGVGYYP